MRPIPPPLHPHLTSPTTPPPVLGKAEGPNTDWHGHVTALTVAPPYRRLGLARRMIEHLERISDDAYRAFFVDLYVRCVNFAAIKMYEGFGYSVYRRVREYYSNLGLGYSTRDEEDGFGASFLYNLLYDYFDTIGADMRKPLSRDPMRRSVRANGKDIVVSANEVP